jgi:hypothetical protein
VTVPVVGGMTYPEGKRLVDGICAMTCVDRLVGITPRGLPWRRLMRRAMFGGRKGRRALRRLENAVRDARVLP